MKKNRYANVCRRSLGKYKGKFQLVLTRENDRVRAVFPVVLPLPQRVSSLFGVNFIRCVQRSYSFGLRTSPWKDGLRTELPSGKQRPSPHGPGWWRPAALSMSAGHAHDGGHAGAWLCVGWSRRKLCSGHCDALQPEEKQRDLPPPGLMQMQGDLFQSSRRPRWWPSAPPRPDRTSLGGTAVLSRKTWRGQDSPDRVSQSREMAQSSPVGSPCCHQSPPCQNWHFPKGELIKQAFSCQMCWENNFGWKFTMRPFNDLNDPIVSNSFNLV